MFEISNIRIGGFSAIHRTGECSVNIGLQGTDVVIDFGNSKFNSIFLLTIMQFCYL